jgi:hypothetical protein
VPWNILAFECMEVVSRQPTNQYCTHETEYNFTMQCNQNIIKDVCSRGMCSIFHCSTTNIWVSICTFWDFFIRNIFYDSCYCCHSFHLHSNENLKYSRLVQINGLTIHSWSNRQFLCAVRILCEIVIDYWLHKTILASWILSSQQIFLIHPRFKANHSLVDLLVSTFGPVLKRSSRFINFLEKN